MGCWFVHILSPFFSLQCLGSWSREAEMGRIELMGGWVGMSFSRKWHQVTELLSNNMVSFGSAPFFRRVQISVSSNILSHTCRFKIKTMNQVKSGYMSENNPFSVSVLFSLLEILFFTSIQIQFVHAQWNDMPCIGSRLKNFQIAIKLEHHKLPRIDPAARVLSPSITRGIIFASNYWHHLYLTFMIFTFSSPTFCVFVEASNFDFGCGPRQRKRANAASSSYSEARKCSCYFRPFLNLDHPLHHDCLHNQQAFIIMIMAYSHQSLLGSKLEARKYSRRS